MKKFLKIFLIIAVCFFTGYGIGALFSSAMKANKTEKDYIGASTIKIEDGVMTPETLLAMGRISNPQISPDGKKVLYTVSYTSIEQNRSCANLFVSDIDGNNRRQLTKFAQSVSGACWAPDGKSIYFLQDGKLWNAAVGGKKLGARRQISKLRGSIVDFKLSPSGKSVLYISTIPGPVRSPKDVDERLDKAQAYITEGLMYRHWDHWVTETPRTYIAPVNAVDENHSIDLLGDEPYDWISRIFNT